MKRIPQKICGIPQKTMKKHIFLPVLACLSSAFIFPLTGCGSPSAVPETAEAPAPKSAAPSFMAKPIAPTATPIIVYTGKPSLPAAPQMLDSHPSQSGRSANSGDLLEQFPVADAPRQSSAAHNQTSRRVKTHPVTPMAQGGGSGQVWVNDKTNIYHFPGTRFYGKTKQGHYASESEARASGATAAQNGQ